MFYVDAAFAVAKLDKKLALQIVGSMLELDPDDDKVTRLAAWLYDDLGAHDRALILYRHRRERRPEDPTSLRDLMFALLTDSRDESAALSDEIMATSWHERHANTRQWAASYALAMQRLPENEAIKESNTKFKKPGIIITAKWLDRDEDVELLIRESSGGFVCRDASLFGFCQGVGNRSVSYIANEELHGPVEIYIADRKGIDVELLRLEIANFNDGKVTTESMILRPTAKKNIVLVKKTAL